MSFSLDASLSVDLGAGGLVQDRDDGRPFDLVAGAFVQGELRVTRFLGVEQLHGLYHYDVSFITDADPRSIQVGTLGLPACLTLHAAGHQPRVVQGLVSTIESIGRLQAGRAAGRRLYRLRISPRAWLLTQRARPRVFQDASPLTIVSRILDLAQVPYEWRTHAGDRAWPFAYQRDETDWQFVTRVLATAGISFCFEHAHGLLETLLPGSSAYAALGVNPMHVSADALGGGLLGATLSGAIGVVASATKIVFFDRPGLTPAVSDDLAADEAIAGVASAALGAVASSLGGALDGALGAVGVDFALVLGPSADPIDYEDGLAVVDGREHVSRLSLRRNVRSRRAVVHEHLTIAQRDNMTVAETGYAETSISASLDVGLSAVTDLAHGDFMGSLTAGIPGVGGFDATVAPPLPTVDEMTFEEHGHDPSMLDSRWTVDYVVPEPAERALEQLRYDAVEADGVTNSRRIAPGYRFKLQGHPSPECNREYVATSVRCEGVDPELAETEDVAFVYRAELKAVPAVGRVRPPKPASAPRLGYEVATVVGPPGSPLYVDDCNRVQVKFAWADQSPIPSDGEDDLYGLVDNTCFLPVVTPWGGPGYGMQFPLRVGMQVVVGFLGGRGETPFVAGCVWTEWNKRPFPSALKSGVRTRSEPGGMGYNEISFDDLAGRETVHIHGARDIVVDTARNMSTQVGADLTQSVSRHASFSVGGAQFVGISGNASRIVGGSRSEQTDGSKSSTVGQLSDEYVGGDSTVQVNGSRTEIYAATRSVNVADFDECQIGTTQRVRVGTATRAGNIDILATGDHVVTAKTVTLRGTERLRLECGGASLELTPDGLKLLGDAIVAKGKTLGLQASGSSLDLDDSARLQTGKSALKMDDAFSVKASSVALSSGSGASKSDKKDDSKATDAPKRKLTVTFLTGDKPLANEPYEMSLDGDDPINGSTDGSGKLDVDVGTAAIATVTIAGVLHTYELLDEPPADSDEWAVAAVKLAHLGHMREGQSSMSAIARYQAEQGLDVTGLLDSTTLSKLKGGA